MVGLTGGIVKIGDKMKDMTGLEVDVIRRLLPVYKKSARPVDLFDKETPELWHLKVEADFDSWDVVGLFNWGENWIKGKRAPEGVRTIEAGFSDLGIDPNHEYLAFDFWNESFLGIYQERIALELAPRTVKVICLRPLPDHPIFLSYNRHLTQGAMDIEDIRWDPGSKTLAGKMSAAPGYEYHLYFYCPEGYTLKAAETGGGETEITRHEDLIRMDLVSQIPSIEWRLRF